MIRRWSWIIYSSNQIVYRLTGYDLKEKGLGPIAKGGIYNFIGLLVTSITAFLFQFILGKNLSPGEVGIFNLGLTISSIIGLVILVGLDRGVVRFIAHYRGINNQERTLGAVESSFRMLLVTTVVLTPIIWIMADDISQYIFNKPELAPVLRILILTLPLVTFTRWSVSVFLGYKRVKPMVFIEQILVPVSRILFVLIIIYFFSKSIVAISQSYLIASIPGFLLAGITLWIYIRSQNQNVRAIPIYYELFAFSWPLMFSGLLNRTNTYTETLILGGLSTSDQVGIYTISLKISIILTMFFEAINGIWAPYIADLISRMEFYKLSQQFKNATYWAFSLTLPFALIMFLESPLIMAIFGREYMQGAQILRILAISQVIYVLGGMSALILIMAGYSRLNLIDLILTFLLSLLLDFLLIPFWGASGAAIASAATVIFITLLRSGQVYLKMHIHPYHKDYYKPLVAGLISFLVVILIKPLFTGMIGFVELILIGLLLFGIYSLLMIMFLKTGSPWSNKTSGDIRS